MGGRDRRGARRNRPVPDGLKTSGKDGSNPRHHGKSIGCSIRLAHFEVTLDGAHLVGHVGEADNVLTPCLRESVERRRLHLDREDAACPRRSDCGLRLAERFVSGLGRSGQHVGAVAERIV